MKKEKFHIVMPDEETIKVEIRHIVTTGLARKESFSSYLTTVYKQIGFKYLFYDRLNSILILFACLTVFSFLAFSLNPSTIIEEELYTIIFFLSPIVFLLFSIYTYTSKIQNNTFEVEMACQYNVFQVIAIKMLFYSISSILINTIFICLVIVLKHDIQFFRAIMISVTSLFLFSSLFLYVLMKKRSIVVVFSLITGWILGNVLIRFVSNELYEHFLLNMPLIVYGIVLFISFYSFLKSIKKMMYIKPAEGAY